METEDTDQRSTSPHINAMNVSEDSSGGSSAYLVQSQDILHTSSFPEVDNRPVARQKRRRTRYVICLAVNQIRLTQSIHSPEDQAILEAEYEKNSKPDKTARQGIVERVALGEKEVQVRVACSSRSYP